VNGKKQWLKTDAMEFWYFGGIRVHNLETGADPRFMGPVSYKIWGALFKKKNAKLRIQN
jgi:hypothetical protein